MTALQEPVEQPLTPEDVAALLQVDRETVYRMARRGELPAFKVSSRWRFLPSHLQRWMEQQGARSVSGDSASAACEGAQGRLAHGLAPLAAGQPPPTLSVDTRP